MISHKVEKSVSVLHRRNATNRFAVVHNTFGCVFEHFSSSIPSKSVNNTYEVQVLAVGRDQTSLLLFEESFLGPRPFVQQKGIAG